VIEVYRLHSSRFPANSGKGAAINGGRWNPRGTEAVYAAASSALAALEILAHYAVLSEILFSVRFAYPMTSLFVYSRNGWNGIGNGYVNPALT
jgi:hypothetical protein